MSPTSLPSFKVLLTPQFDLNGAISSLNVSLEIEPCEVEEGSPVVAFSQISKDLVLKIEEGQIHILSQSSHSDGDVLIAKNKIQGVFKLSYHVSPSSREEIKSCGGLELRQDQGGLLGSGLTFIPIPLGDKIYRNEVEWDLSQAPPSTRAVWTYGEGPSIVQKIGPASTLNDSVYMVGNIQSHPQEPMEISISDYYGYYWFGTLPPNITVIQNIHHEFFMKIADFFDDAPTKENPYRSFVRKSGDRDGFGGTSFTRSHIFDYDDRIEQAEDYDLVRRMSYEMSHNWLGPKVTDKEIDWFYEGLKNCLSVYFPFRNKFRTGHYFQATISMLCTRYYTNPLVNLPHNEVVELAATDDYAKELLSFRAWAFAVGTDLRARRMSELIRPVEDLAIKPLSKKRSEGQPHGVQEWLAYLQPLMGTEAQERYDEMLSGKIILLDPGLFGAKTHYLKQVDQEVLDFGMDRSSFKEMVVKGLEKGSRAEEAGLKEGDVIVKHSYLWRCVDHFEEKMKVVVLRDLKAIEISYWPRSFVMAKSWQMVKKEDEM